MAPSDLKASWALPVLADPAAHVAWRATKACVALRYFTRWLLLVQCLVVLLLYGHVPLLVMCLHAARVLIFHQNISFTPVDHVAHVLREMMANTTFVQLASSETCKGSTRCDRCTLHKSTFHKSFPTCLPPPPLARRNHLVHPHGSAHRFILRLGGRGTGEEGGMVFLGRAAEENMVMWHCGGYFFY